jgi:arsenate reductase
MRTTVKRRSSIATLAAVMIAAVAGVTSAQTPTPASPLIVFVCEHGAAKSVIATAYFNTIAAERGLPDRATYRGAHPQAELSVNALTGLKEDGLTLPTEKPSPISAADVAGATHIFAIGCSLPSHAASSGKADSWDDVPEDQGYAAQRDAIKRHVERLIDQLQQNRK